MNIRPLQDNLVVRQDPPKEKLNSGLFLPQGSRELNDDLGTVVAVGPKVEDVKVGDRVSFKRRPASHLGEFHEQWKDYLLLKEEDIVGVVEG